MAEAVNVREIPSYTHMTGEIYDIIYQRKDYTGQAQKIVEIIAERNKSGGNSVLEAACGTGSYLAPLSEHFQVEGFDLSAEQVDGAKKKLPALNIFEADMRDFQTDTKYDNVLCLFSSIGYVLSKEELDKTVQNFADHTKPGGLVIIEPWLKAEDLIPNHISMETEEKDDISVMRMGTLTADGKITTLKMHHLVGHNQQVEHFLETHTLAMHTDEDFVDAYKKAGLTIEIDPHGLTGRRLYIGQKI